MVPASFAVWIWRTSNFYRVCHGARSKRRNWQCLLVAYVHFTPPPPPGGGGGYVSLGLVHHPRKSLSEKHPKRGWSLGQFWHPIPGNHWTTLIFRDFFFSFSHAILYPIQVLLPLLAFWPKRNKEKANSSK